MVHPVAAVRTDKAPIDVPTLVAWIAVDGKAHRERATYGSFGHCIWSRDVSDCSSPTWRRGCFLEDRIVWCEETNHGSGPGSAIVSVFVKVGPQPVATASSCVLAERGIDPDETVPLKRHKLSI